MADILDVMRIELRPWDSEFFGHRIAQVTGHEPTAVELTAVVEQARSDGIECLYFLADADHHESVRAAEANGFGLTDVRLTLETTAGAQRGPYPEHVRPARPDDLPALVALARVSHRNTRFYADPRFDSARSDELYAVWIERSVRGEIADAVHVVDLDDAARGYLTLSAGEAGATIGLVAVDAAYRSRGLGDALLRSARQWTAERGLDRVSVVTQGRSAASIRFYERAGFTTTQVQFWYHRWLRAS